MDVQILHKWRKKIPLRILPMNRAKMVQRLSFMHWERAAMTGRHIMCGPTLLKKSGNLSPPTQSPRGDLITHKRCNTFLIRFFSLVLSIGQIKQKEYLYEHQSSNRNTGWGMLLVS